MLGLYGISDTSANQIQHIIDGKQKDYLRYSILGILLKEGRISSAKDGNRCKYKYAK